MGFLSWLTKAADSAELSDQATISSLSLPSPPIRNILTSPDQIINLDTPLADPLITIPEQVIHQRPEQQRLDSTSPCWNEFAALTDKDLGAALALRDFLAREDIWRMKKLPVHILTYPERDILSDLSRSFPCLKRKRTLNEADGVNNSGGVDDDDAMNHAQAVSTGATGSNRRSRPSPYRGGRLGRPRKPAAEMYSGQLAPLINKQQLTLPSVLLDHITVNGTDPRAFLENEVAIKYHAAHMSSNDSLTERFAACYSFAINLEERNEMDRIRWCFTLLMFYDFMQLLCPGTTGGRTGHVMTETAIDFLSTVFHDQPAKLADAVDNLSKWNRWGMKIQYLCEDFGEGAVFFLAQHLSPDFLERKFPTDGAVIKRAIANLRSLDLQRKGLESGTTELGSKLRLFMIKPLKEKLAEELEERL